MFELYIFLLNAAIVPSVFIPIPEWPVWVYRGLSSFCAITVRNGPNFHLITSYEIMIFVFVDAILILDLFRLSLRTVCVSFVHYSAHSLKYFDSNFGDFFVLFYVETQY